MGWGGLILVFVMSWFTVIFAVLPWGNRHDVNAEHSQSMGIPENPRLWLKAGVTTILSLVITAGVYLIAESGLINFRV
ncbi:MAG: DUF1467 family protein [Pseudomonadota bacterium]